MMKHQNAVKKQATNLPRVILTAAVLLLSLCSLTAVPLNFAVPAMHSGLEMLQVWKPIADYLEQECQFDITLHIVKDYEALQTGMLAKNYDIGYVNALYENRIITAGKGSIDTRARSEINGKNTFTTALIVNKDSVTRTMQEMQGRYLALTIAHESLGGYYIPLCLFNRAGIDPSQVFSQIIFSGTYDSILKGVAFGVLDAGAVMTAVLEDDQYREISSQVRIIEESQAVPQWAMIAQTGLRESMIDTCIYSITRMGETEEGARLLHDAGITSFTQDHGKQFSQQSSPPFPAGYLACIGEIDAAAR
jgi:phosphate/phosphite/phosphonate ABC transporter binding protein